MDTPQSLYKEPEEVVGERQIMVSVFFRKLEEGYLANASLGDQIHEELRQHECEIFDLLQIPYRVVDTATGDLGGPAYRKYDLEAWMPARLDDSSSSAVRPTRDRRLPARR